MKEVLHALDFMHTNSIIHRDIKCANILIRKNGNVKLCDFGVSSKITSSFQKL